MVFVRNEQGLFLTERRKTELKREMRNRKMKKSLVALTAGMILSLTACGLAPQVNAKAPEDDAERLWTARSSTSRL